MLLARTVQVDVDNVNALCITKITCNFKTEGISLKTNYLIGVLLVYDLIDAYKTME